MKSHPFERIKEATDKLGTENEVEQNFADLLRQCGMNEDDAPEGAKALLGAIRHHPVESGLE